MLDRIVLVLMCLVLWGNAKSFVVENGKTIILSTTLPNPQSIQIHERTYSWIPHPKDPTRKIAILAIPYFAKPSVVTLEDGSVLTVTQGNYKNETIQVNPSKIKPNPKEQERIQQERAEANAIYSNHAQERLWDSAFILPIESKITSVYGNARTFNGELKSYHGGTDFRAAIGTEIFASNRGKVVIAKERFLAGGSVVLDHGEGVFSVYYHCSELKVKVGEIVEKGALIALSGDTGRVSGPHLHFGILVKGAQVDPIDFIAQVNGLF